MKKAKALLTNPRVWLCLLVCAGVVSLIFSSRTWHAGALAAEQVAFSPDGIWQANGTTQAEGLTGQTPAWRLDRGRLEQSLSRAPRETSAPLSASPAVVSLPMPSGSFTRFRLAESSLFEPGLAAKYPEIKMYAAQGVDDPAATARLTWSPRGFQAFILTGAEAVSIQPAQTGDLSNYVSYASSSQSADAQELRCQVEEKSQTDPARRLAPAASVGGTLRVYRVAIATTQEYTNQANLGGGSVANTLASLATWLGGINATLEKEAAVRLVLVANNNLVVFTAEPDGFTNGNNNTMIGEVPGVLSANIGSANFDIGHVFGTIGSGGSGLAGIGVICNNSAIGGGQFKARGSTLFSGPSGQSGQLGVIIHEFGHELGANHTFNVQEASGNCAAANRNGATAWEVASGSTLMSYGGICSTNNLSGKEFRLHAGSFGEITAVLAGATCNQANWITTNNNVPTVNAGGNFTIPKGTPFTLTASGSDADAADVLTYTWDQVDAGNAFINPPYGDQVGDPNTTTRPLFRPFPANSSPARIFPSLTYILNNANVPPATVNGFITGENLPSVSRTMNFRATVRDNHANGGGVNEATAVITVDGVSGPFAVTSPNGANNITGGVATTVTWNVAGSSGAPVNAANVKISLSTDGGNTFPIVLAASTPNDGTQSITFPNGVLSTQARIKVEAVGNIFFDISDANFNITPGDGCPAISGISPAIGNVGTSVVITGTNFTSATAVKFANNVNATFTVNNNTQITATVPAGATTGAITISKAGCADTTTGTFQVCPNPPTTLQVDDGSYESATQVGGSVGYYVNRLTPASYPATLSRVSIRFDGFQGVTAGTAITVLSGTSNNGTNIDGTTFQTLAAQVGTLGQFANYDVTPITITQGDFVVGFSIAQPGGTFPGLFDSTAPQGRSYSSSSGTTFSVLSGGSSGNLAIRANVFTGNCAPASDATAPTAVVAANNVTTVGGTTYQFTVTYSDNVALNVATLNTGDVNVSGPGGFNVAANFVSVDINSNGTPRTATYSITPPGGAWDLADNGTYTVTMNASQVADTSGNFVATGALGTFTVNIAGDVTAPTASVTAANVTTAGATTYQFTIAYSDNVAINVATLGNGDANVSGPGGFNQAVTFVNVNINTNGTPRTVTYSITPPGGAWDLADNGTYTVTMNASQVADTSGNNVAAGALGTFTVNIGCITSVTVNNTGDGVDVTPGNGVCETALGNGICTLRAAIQEANALTACAPFTINFSALFNAAQTINLGTALPALDHPNLTINGTGANLVTVQRNAVANFRIFAVNAARTVVINGLTITGGNVVGDGGGILNSGTLTLVGCQIAANTASQFGGGIFNTGGTLTINESAITGNTASGGQTGGGVDASGSFLTASNTTFSGNTAPGNGSAGGVIAYGSNATFTNCTFSDNEAAAGSGGVRGDSSATLTFRNCLIAANRNNTTVPDVGFTVGTTFTSNGFNLIGNVGTVTAFNQAGDQTGTGANPRNPLITVLQNNGGPTSTHALLPGSTAINAGTNTGAPATDQRGIARPQQTTTDIGAYESRGFTLAIVSGNNQSTQINAAFANPLVASVTSANGEPVNGGRVTFTPPGAGASAVLTGSPATIAGGQASVNATANATVGGPYNVAANATGAAAAVNFALTNNAAGDTTAPTASVTANEVTTPGATTYQFTITYSDNVAINVATLGNGDANVSGPGGFNQAATFVSVNINTNGTPRTATYQITPPGGGWVPQTFNGTYTVTMNASQVADTNGNFVAAGALGTFNVVIGCVTSVTVNTVADAADATPGNGVCETGAGNGICTLRAAIQEANALPNCAPFTINFSVNGIFQLGTALPALDHPNLTINGPGANLANVTRSAASLFRIFTNNAGRTATLSGLTISNGELGAIDVGGAVRNNGTLTITNCAVINSHANGAGGIYNAGTLTLTGSTISGNMANFDGGGLYNVNGATANLTNCTISGNQAGSSGSGLGAGVIHISFSGSGSLQLTNCTITANTSVTASGGGLAVVTQGAGATATATLRNTLIADNTAPNLRTAMSVGSGAATITSLGNNLASDNGGGFLNAAGDQINAVALLGALANNGGPTSTHALLPGSPAINAGTNTGAPATDQRGIARPQQTTTDIGAFESRGFTLAVVSGSGQSATVNAAFANPLVASVTSANGEPVNGGRVTFTPPGAGASASVTTNPATIAAGQASVMAVANATVGGPYNVAANATGAAAAVNFALTNSAGDVTAPTASVTAANVTTAGATTYQFTVTYSDNVAINVATLGNGDVNVSGPGGFNVAATFVSVNNNTNGTPRIATYQITPPGGAWVPQTFNGTYTVTMNANQVADTAGNNVAAGALGTFNVVIALRRVKADFDGDGKTDLSVWTPNTGNWSVLNSGNNQVQNIQWGAGFAPFNDVIVPGDYDGDGKADHAIWRGADSIWYIRKSSDGQPILQLWGTSNAPYFDIPTPGDFDGDGKTDLAVWRRDGTWFVKRSSDGGFTIVTHGQTGDTPIPADYDGDGKTDFAVFRPNAIAPAPNWFILQSTTNTVVSFQWGAGYAPFFDTPVPADYDADGKADLAIWRGADSIWYIRPSATPNNPQLQLWGTSNAPYFDIPTPADYDGDGKADIAVFRRTGTWFVLRSSNGTFLIQTQGQQDDVPVPANGVR